MTNHYQNSAPQGARQAEQLTLLKAYLPRAFKPLAITLQALPEEEADVAMAVVMRLAIRTHGTGSFRAGALMRLQQLCKANPEAITALIRADIELNTIAQLHLARLADRPETIGRYEIARAE